MSGMAAIFDISYRDDRENEKKTTIQQEHVALVSYTSF